MRFKKPIITIELTETQAMELYGGLSRVPLRGSFGNNCESAVVADVMHDILRQLDLSKSVSQTMEERAQD